MKWLCTKLRVPLLAGGLLLSSTSPAESLISGPNPWLSRPLTEKRLESAITAGADYLARNLLPDGQFVYIKDPFGNCCKDKGDKYSLVRHAGAVYALLRAHQVNGDPAYLEASKRALAFLSRFIESRGKARFVKGQKRRTDLGESGFTLIAMALYEKLSGSREFHEDAMGLTAFLKEHLKPGGRLVTKNQDAQWAEDQALIGLVHSHLYLAKDPEIAPVAKRWLDAKKGKASHWSLLAYYWFSRIDATGAQKYVARALQGASELLRNVGTIESTSLPRLVGARGDRLASCGTTARNEGLIAASMLARDYGYEEAASTLQARAREHIAHALLFQYGQSGNFYAGDSKRTRLARLFKMEGGVFNHPDDGFVRIDYVAHHIRALVAYHLLDRSPAREPSPAELALSHLVH